MARRGEARPALVDERGLNTNCDMLTPSCGVSMTSLARFIFGAAVAAGFAFSAPLAHAVQAGPDAGDLGLALPQALHLGPAQLDPAHDVVQDQVVVPGPPVRGDHPPLVALSAHGGGVWEPAPRKSRFPVGKG